MNRNYYVTQLFLFIALSLAGCSSEEGDTSSGIPYTDVDSTSGFSIAYLTGKSFYRPEDYFGNDFIETRQFSGSSVSWSDNLFMNNGSAPYSIISHNGIDGILQYNDGVYDLFYNIYSVETDHLKLCYTYGDINTIVACTESVTQKWYFDRATAELNYP